MIPRATRAHVRRRAHHRCEYCGLSQEAATIVPFHIEHVIPRQHGGSDAASNLALACYHCNQYKGPNLTGIDPATGEPTRGCRSVTIVTDRAVIADGLSKGVFILGPEAGMALIERLPGVQGVIVSAKNEVLISSGLKGRLTILQQPTDAP